MFYFLCIYPNNLGETPFDIAIREHAPKSVEIMLEMLSGNPKYNYSKYLQKHFMKLLNMNSQAFQRFLNICTFKINRFFKC